MGERVYASLKDVPAEIDIIDVFRRPSACPGGQGGKGERFQDLLDATWKTVNDAIAYSLDEKG